MALLQRLELAFFSLFNESGQMLTLFARAILEAGAVFRGWRRTLRHMLQFGLYTLPLAAFIGLFTGMVTGLETGLALREFGATQNVGVVVGLSLVREMGPVITAFIICGRVGAAMTAELCTMAVTDELDVLRSLGISPIRYLVVPRFFAMLLMAPTLTIYSIMIGIWGGAVVATTYLGVQSHLYYSRLYDSLSGMDIVHGMSKTVVFGAIIAIVCCHMGLTTRNGAEGVGRNTMRAVVISLTAILICDFFMARFVPVG